MIIEETKGKDIARDLEVDLFDAVQGAKYKLQYSKRVVCHDCGGSRCEKNTAPSKCWTCGGKGFVSYKAGATHNKETCSKCQGGGMTIKHPCKTCKGEGLVEGLVETFVHIPRGSHEGEVLHLKDKGHDSHNGKSGDLHLKLKYIPGGHGFWQEGDDLNSHYNLQISDVSYG